MRIVVFCHSLASDWNHGNAHFLRGIAGELVARGHAVDVWEPRHGWSRTNLLHDHGEAPLGSFREAFPTLRSRLYDLDAVELEPLVDDGDLVLVHEWNDPWLVAELGRLRARGGGFRLLFHDTHHRAVTARKEMKRYDLSGYDGVLAFGSVLRDVYLDRGWAERAWTWHEAADTRTFRPLPAARRKRDLVWVGNWGDGERTRELREFLLRPAERLGLTGTVRGVRYPPEAARAVERAGLSYRGWVANHRVPKLFARHRATVHVPRRPYLEALPGIPTIRMFEALACGIPLVCSPWDDAEGLFTRDRDYLSARDGSEMTRQLREVLADRALARTLADHGLATVLARHTCAHRVDELLAIASSLGVRAAEATA
jgi:spore maturation protein CgeB